MEKLSIESEIIDIPSLDAQTKMRYVLEIFDLGKDKEKNEERKNNFMELVKKYNEMLLRSKLLGGDNESYVKGRADAHNQLMDIITKMSLSHQLNKSQRMLTEYLSEDRDRISQMISDYFLGHSSSNPDDYTDLHKALRGEGEFQYSGKKEED